MLLYIQLAQRTLIFSKIAVQIFKIMLIKAPVSEIESSVDILKTISASGCLENEKLFTLRFHSLSHLAEVVLQFGDLSFLDTLLFEPLNYIIKMFIRMRSMRKLSRTEEPVNAMNVSPASESDAVPNIPKKHRAQLCRNDVKICPHGLRSSTNSSFANLTVGEKRLIFRFLELKHESSAKEMTPMFPSNIFLFLKVVNSVLVSVGKKITFEEYDAMIMGLLAGVYSYRMLYSTFC